MALPAEGQLKGELESLKDFKKRVDGILSRLESSPASPTKVGQQEVDRAAFGGSFAEADGLYTEYNRVHSELTKLSKVLGAQIEAMSIAVHGADVGFGNLEDDLTRRFWRLQNQTRQYQQERQRTDKPGSKDEATESAY